MKVYADEKSLAIECPACHVKPGVCCAYDINGPLVHERRDRQSHEDVG